MRNKSERDLLRHNKLDKPTIPRVYESAEAELGNSSASKNHLGFLVFLTYYFVVYDTQV